MSHKTGKIIAAIVCVVLAAVSGFFAMVLYGLARMDSGIVTWTPQLMFACAAPALLFFLAIWIFSRRS